MREKNAPTYFNSRPSARGDRQDTVSRWHVKISIHAPPRGATAGVLLLPEPRRISIHAPPRGATASSTPSTTWASISIHAPPRGATSSSSPSSVSAAFQFTPLREGRREIRTTPSTPATSFQFTPLREGRRPGENPAGEGQTISIHAPPRGATAITRWSSTSRDYFNSRPSARGDENGNKVAKCIILFQFTPLREGRRQGKRLDALGTSYFNSRPSARGDKGVRRGDAGVSISIHAPPRGATRRTAFSILLPYFNSRPSARGDVLKETFAGHLIISIHAPPRGATAQVPRWDCVQYFNSRPSARGDPTDMHLARSFSSFQFTPLREGRPFEQMANAIPYIISIHAPPRGATQLRHSACPTWIYFNSRPSARGDAIRIADALGGVISIHAPPRGATPRRLRIARRRDFNSRPSARGDDAQGGVSASADISIHAPPRGATRTRQECHLCARLFQFTPLREGRLHQRGRGKKPN